jgi:hypothetical protein
MRLYVRAGWAKSLDRPAGLRLILLHDRNPFRPGAPSTYRPGVLIAPDAEPIGLADVENRSVLKQVTDVSPRLLRAHSTG